MGGIEIISMATAMEGRDELVRIRMWESGLLVSVSRVHGVIFGQLVQYLKPSICHHRPCKMVWRLRVKDVCRQSREAALKIPSDSNPKAWVSCC